MKKTEGPGKDPARWEQRYLAHDLPWDSGAPDAHLSRVIAGFEIAPTKALELGCGTGTNAIWLHSLGFDVVALDLSPTAIHMAQTKATAAGAECRFMVADLLAESIPGGPFQFIYDRACFHVFDADDERARFAAQVAAHLAPDGLWYSLIGSTDGPPRETGPPRRRAAEIVAAVEPHFEILQLTSTAFDDEQHAQARAWVLVARRRGSSPPRDDRSI